MSYIYGDIPATVINPNSITINTTAPLGGGGTVTLGSALTLTDSSTLAQVLGNGASSGPRDISMDTGQAINFTGSGVGASLLRTAQTGAANRTVNIPDLAANDTLATLAATQTLTNKSLQDSTTFFIDNTDATRRMQFELSGITTATTRTLTVPNFNGTIATLTGTETLTSKTLTSPVINTPNLTGGTINNATVGATTATTGRFTNVTCVDTTNQIRTGAGANITTINCPASVGAVTLTLPNTTDTLVGRATTDTLTNKTITGSSNNVDARALVNNSGANSVSTFLAANPTAGQVLTATGTSTATWQTPTLPAWIAVGTSSEDNFVLTSGTPQDITGSTVTIVTTGTYKFSWTSYITSSSVVGDIQVNFIQNTTSIPNSLRKLTASTTGAKMGVASECILGCTAGDVVKMSIVANSNLTAMVGFRTLIGQRIA
jgi:hypothetical protein